MTVATSAPKGSGPPAAPVYRRIRDELRALISAGVYRPYERLPSEAELMCRFGVSRVTVRQALDRLREERVVHSVQGKGSFVSMPKVVHDCGVLLGFHEALAGRGYEASSRLLSAHERRATREIAQALQLKPRSAVLEVRRVRSLAHQPVSLDVSYFPVDIGARLLREDLTRDIFPLLEDACGVQLGRAQVSIEAERCEAGAARDLALAPGEPVLHLRRLTWSSGGRPVDYEHLYCRADAWQYRVELKRRKRA
jgi:GntR family transcriptional regulator